MDLLVVFSRKQRYERDESLETPFFMSRTSKLDWSFV